MHVSIVVLNWNKKKLTLTCLSSLKKLKTEDHQLSIVVVDNASTDGSVTALRNFQFPISNFQFKLIINKENLGFAEGNNVGIKYALKNGADFVMVLNNDTITDKNLLVQLIKVVKSNPKVGIMSPKIYFAKGFEFHKRRYRKSDLGKVIWYAGGGH